MKSRSSQEYFHQVKIKGIRYGKTLKVKLIKEPLLKWEDMESSKIILNIEVIGKFMSNTKGQC